MKYHALVFVLLIFTGFSKVEAGEFAGSVATEHRQFLSSEQFEGQKSGSVPSLTFEPEYFHTSEDRAHNIVGKAFFRYDPSDNQRTHFDIRQADWTFAQDDWEVRAGISRVFWGVIESRKLVDTLNQVDQVEDIDEEDRLGQLMIQATTFQDWGTLRAFYLPYFRERTFPGREGRLRGPLVVDTDNPRYEEEAEEFYPNLALRYSHFFGGFDVGISQFHGTGREPTFIIEGDHAIPFYETINQTSLDVQYTTDAWLWKLEVLYREGQGDDFVASSGGFEYTFFGINDNNHDLGLLAEYHHDRRDNDAPATLFDDDMFMGVRYVLNNAADTEILAGITTDLQGQGTFSVIEASHRLDDNWKLEMDVRFFGDVQRTNQLNFLNNDDFVQIRLSYFF